NLESRRPDTGRPDRRPGLPADAAAVGRSPVAALGAGTVAGAGDQRRTPGDRAGRRPGRPDREAVPAGCPAGPLHRRVAVDWVDSDYRRSVRKSSTTVESLISRVKESTRAGLSRSDLTARRANSRLAGEINSRSEERRVGKGRKL